MKPSRMKPLVRSGSDPVHMTPKTLKEALTKPSTEASDEMAFHLKANGLSFEREFRFHPTRRWKADFRVEGGLLLEVDGGGYQPKGGHTTGKAYEDDREKDAHALAMGFVMLRVTPKQVKSGEAIAWAKAIIGREDFGCCFWCPMCGAGK